jgi:hypothetical protein
LKVMHNQLGFNICNLPTSCLRNIDMPDFQQRLSLYIPAYLRYVCRFWVDHLCEASYDPSSAHAAEKLLLKQFLFWLEVLSLLGMVDHAPRALSKLMSWANEVGICCFALWERN